MRAKRTLAEARVPFEVPRGDERAARLSSVLEVIYLIFNEGYAATAGDDWMRPALCEDALRLGRILAELAPEEPEVHGLVALMEIQASRSRRAPARSGEPILLLEQNRARWDQLLIRRGLAALDARRGARRRARSLRACRPRSPPATRGRGSPADTDWARIAALYDALAKLAPSPVVELNRAVAVAMAFGPAAGLTLVDALMAEPALSELPPPAERARRFSRQARPLRGGARRVRARRIAHPQRPRARAAARARPRERGVRKRRIQ